jgi:hypothetical protein
VRVHVGPGAPAMGALAFTLGEEIHFAPGLYNPSSREGLALLGHELTHVVQQRDQRVTNPYGSGVAIVQDPALEAEADRMGQRVAGEIFVRAQRALQPKVRGSGTFGCLQMFRGDDMQTAVEHVFPVWKILKAPGDYPSYMGDLMGFHVTALPNVFNPIVGVREELRHDTFINGVDVANYRPKSDGCVYREFHTKGNKIIAFADIEPGGSPTFNQISPHFSLGYLGIRKVQLEDKELYSVLEKKYGLTKNDISPGDQKQGFLWNFYRSLEVEEQGLSTNLNEKSAEFMPGCKMYRLSLYDFLERFPYGEDSPLLADWDHGYIAEAGPAGDPGHVDIKLNPLWLDKHKPWKGKLTRLDGNFYRDLLNHYLAENRDLWKPVRH